MNAIIEIVPSVLDRIRKPRRLRLSDEDLHDLAIPAGLCTGVAL